MCVQVDFKSIVKLDRTEAMLSSRLTRGQFAAKIAESPGQFYPLFSDGKILARPLCKNILPRGNRSQLGYHVESTSYPMRVKQTFSVHLPSLKGVILDAGCSEGFTTCELAESYPEAKVVGIDIFHYSLNIAGEKYSSLISQERIAFLLADGYNLNLCFDSSVRFSAIFFMNNLVLASEYMEHSEIKGIISQAIHFIEENGYLLLSADKNFAILQKKGPQLFIPDFLEPPRFVYGTQSRQSAEGKLLNRINDALNTD